MQTIFVVEDDEDIREIVLYALRSGGFEAVGFERGADFFGAVENGLPSLVLLDIMLPGDDGLFLLKRLRGLTRTKNLPIIMLTAKGSEFDKVKALDMGADDYVTKPFSVMELISRVHAVLRRSGTAAEQNERLAYKNIRLDHKKRVVYSDEKAVTVTYKEYELLYYLLMNTGIALARDRIMEAVWGYDFEGESRTLDTHIRSLRQKLGAAGEHITTVRGVGYKIGE